MKSFVRISSLLWGDILVAYALFVMQNYLTGVWNFSIIHAAGFLNIWSGISMILPLFFQIFVDVGLGNFGMLIISSIAYSTGIVLVTLSTPPFTGSCKEYEHQCIGHTQKVLFYTGMPLIAVGMAGNIVSVRPFLDVQEDNPEDDGCLLACLRILGAFKVLIVPLVGAIALPYIKPWVLRFGIPAICTALGTILFLTGICCLRYKRDEPNGSPITNIFRVFVAFVPKLCLPFPADNRKFFKRDDENVQSFTQTRCLRFLEKAAIIREGIDEEEQRNNRWKLCSVQEVEEAKIAVRMVPMWLTLIICGIVSSFGNTYFVEQAKNLDRHMGSWNVPLPAFLLFFKSIKKLFGKGAVWLSNTDKRYGPPVGIAVAMVFSILCCITAAKIEQRRLHTIRKHNLIDEPDKSIPMSVYWLLFQFFLLAGLDSFFEKSAAAFYVGQAPASMTYIRKKDKQKRTVRSVSRSIKRSITRSITNIGMKKDEQNDNNKNYYVAHLTRAVFGLGYMSSALTVHLASRIKPHWFRFTLNKSRLDKYYWLLTAMSSVNLGLFVLVACFYKYKMRVAEDGSSPDVELPEAETGEAVDKQIGGTFGWGN